MDANRLIGFTWNCSERQVSGFIENNPSFCKLWLHSANKAPRINDKRKAFLSNCKGSIGLNPDTFDGQTSGHTFGWNFAHSVRFRRRFRLQCRAVNTGAGRQEQQAQ